MEAFNEKQFYNGLVNFGIQVNTNESKSIFEALRREDGLHLKDFCDRIRVNNINFPLLNI